MNSKRQTQALPAPGARVEIRDEEWVVRRCEQAAVGALAVHVTGTSELVRGKEAIFLSDLDPVQVLAPEDTALVLDETARFRKSRLFLEALLRQSPPTGPELALGYRAAMDELDYQLRPTWKALCQPRARILMADAVGLGKTIEAGVLLSELIRRGRGRRILVVALKSILAQFQKELWARFTIPLVRLDSIGLQRVQAKIPSRMNPFHHYDRVIISIDTLKKDQKYRHWLENTHWDVVVVDECQNVAVRGPNMSRRARLAQLLARTCDSLILTSATPHDGSPESFASLMNLLDPTAVADEKDYTRDQVRGLFVRQFKKDVAAEAGDAFTKRHIKPIKTTASTPEEAVFQNLASIEFKTIARTRKSRGALFRTLLLKAFLSSPAACAATIQARLQQDLVRADNQAAAHDRAVLSHLLQLVAAVGRPQCTKLGAFLALLRSIGVDQRAHHERLVVFSERIATLEMLQEVLRDELGLDEQQAPLFKGDLGDTEQTRLVEDFGTEQSRIRVLLATDAASEGINLHFFCHRLVHYDLPWSLITLEQRNGRIDRYGQHRDPILYYLLTVPGSPGLFGDLRILERLIEKEEAAHKNLGDVAWLMNLHAVEREEQRLARGLEQGEAPQEVIPDVPPPSADFLRGILDVPAPGEARDPPPQRRPMTTLFHDELAWTREALAQVLEGARDAIEWQEELGGFVLIEPPPDLARRFGSLPQELPTQAGQMQLTVQRERVQEALAKARQTRGAWPAWQYLWELHPVSLWLQDRVLASFERHEAPVLTLNGGLTPGERVVVFQGVISNRRSQPILVDWFGCRFPPGATSVAEITPFDDLARATGLAGPHPPANPGRASASEPLRALLPPAVASARAHMAALRQERGARLRALLKGEERRIRAWKSTSLALLDATEAEAAARRRPLNAPRRRKLQEQRQTIERRFENRRDSIVKGLSAVPDAFLRVACLLLGEGRA